MKDTLSAGLERVRRFTVDTDSTIDFMGEALRVYSTPSLVRDMEITCREFLLEHLDTGEDSVGVHVKIDHLAPTLLGMWVDMTIRVIEVSGPKVVFEFDARDPVDAIAKGVHVRFAAPLDKTAERLQAKAEKANGA